MASISKIREGCYEARYRTPEGQSRRKRFARKTDAEKHLVEKEHSKNIGAYVDTRAGRVTFAAFAEEWLKAQTFDESTREAVASRLRVHILPALGKIELRAIRPSTVQAWLRGRQDKCAPRYVRVMLANLSAILGAAVEDGMIVRNPCASKAVRAPRIEHHKIAPWSSEQVAAVIAGHPERFRAMPVVAAGAGLRQGEVFGLRVQDVDFLGRTLHVRQQVKVIHGRPAPAPPKGRKTRTVPLADAVAVALSERLRAFPTGEGGLIFTSREHKPMSRTYYNTHIWKPALIAAGVEPTRANGMHALRHYFASVLLDAGESIRAVADYLGHSDPGFTLRVYTHMMPSSESRTRGAIDAAFGSSRVKPVSQRV